MQQLQTVFLNSEMLDVWQALRENRSARSVARDFSKDAMKSDLLWNGQGTSYEILKNVATALAKAICHFLSQSCCHLTASSSMKSCISVQQRKIDWGQ